MTQQSKFTQDELVILEEDLGKIKEICTPDAITLKPTIKIIRKKDFSDMDKMSNGLVDYCMDPSELKNFWQSKKQLAENNISYLTTSKRRWFYNTSNLETVLYAEDGTRKMEISFPFWIDSENNWKTPKFKKFVQRILDVYDEKGYLPQKTLDENWTSDLSQAVYHKNPEKNSIGKVVMDMVEDLRTILVNHLVEEQYVPISKQQSFKIFCAKNPAKQQISIKESVKRYLKKNKNNIYILGEQFGYIQNASRLLRYQKLRDSVRHPKEIHPSRIVPHQIYSDFKKALPTFNQVSNNNEQFDIDFEAVRTIQELNELMGILDIYADKTVKRGSEKYWQSLEKDGILNKKELKGIQDFILKCNTIAHRNPDADKTLQEVAESAGVLDYLEKASDEHRKRVQRWLRENERNTRYN